MVDKIDIRSKVPKYL